MRPWRPQSLPQWHRLLLLHLPEELPVRAAPVEEEVAEEPEEEAGGFEGLGSLFELNQQMK